MLSEKIYKDSIKSLGNQRILNFWVLIGLGVLIIPSIVVMVLYGMTQQIPVFSVIYLLIAYLAYSNYRRVGSEILIEMLNQVNRINVSDIKDYQKDKLFIEEILRQYGQDDGIDEDLVNYLNKLAKTEEGKIIISLILSNNGWNWETKKDVNEKLEGDIVPGEDEEVPEESDSSL